MVSITAIIQTFLAYVCTKQKVYIFSDSSSFSLSWSWIYRYSPFSHSIWFSHQRLERCGRIFPHQGILEAFGTVIVLIASDQSWNRSSRLLQQANIWTVYGKLKTALTLVDFLCSTLWTNGENLNRFPLTLHWCVNGNLLYFGRGSYTLCRPPIERKCPSRFFHFFDWRNTGVKHVAATYHLPLRN